MLLKYSLVVPACQDLEPYMLFFLLKQEPSICSCRPCTTKIYLHQDLESDSYSLLYRGTSHLLSRLFLPRKEVLTVFIAWLNLALRYASSGLEGYLKTRIQFRHVSPLHIWAIIVIIYSHPCRPLSNCLQGLSLGKSLFT